MKRIIKTSAPVDYVNLITNLQYRKQDILAGIHYQTLGRELFNNLKRQSQYKKLKKQLIEEQGYICCYCNCRIYDSGDTAEHILPIKTHKELLAEYENLLVSCNNSRTQRQTDNTYPNHCDASKNNTILPFTPLDKKSDHVFEYNISDGSIFSKDAHGKSVISILQLDCIKLRENRLAALSILYDDSGQLLPANDLELIFEHIHLKDSNGMHHQYYKCIEYSIYSMF